MTAALKSTKIMSIDHKSYSAERYVQAMALLVHTIQELSLARDLPTIQKIVRTAARKLTGCDGATFVLRDNGFCFYADEDAIAPLWKGKRFPMEICISGWAMINRKPAVIADIYQDDRIPHAAYRPTFVKSLVMVPIRSLDPIGAIGNYWALPHSPTKQEIELLQTLANSTAIAMENVQVYSELEDRVQKRTIELQSAKDQIEKLSLTDEMTGLNNRRGLYVHGNQLIKWSARREQSCSLAFIDVDGLKPVNDELGHDVGDALISDVAGILRACCRESDVLARVGGDEFCVLLSNPEIDGEDFSLRFQERIDSFNKTQSRPYRVSASVGLSTAHVGEAASLDDLLARADEQMYRAKGNKRSAPRSLPA